MIISKLYIHFSTMRTGLHRPNRGLKMQLQGDGVSGSQGLKSIIAPNP
jgi:hypothetical protein